MRTFLRAVLFVCLAAVPAAAQSRVLIVMGLPGEPVYAARFHEWALTLRDAAEKRLGIPAADIALLEDSARAGPLTTGISTKENIEAAITKMAAAAAPADQILIVLIGHGSLQDTVSKLSMPGVDMTAGDFATALAQFKTQRVAFVNLSSGSGDFLPIVSGPNRVIITATKTGFERNESHFGGYFVQAFAKEGADMDKDNRISLLEAFDFARQETQRRYEQSKTLQTEHAILDDNGDAKGSTEPDAKVGDGALAKSFVIQRSLSVAGAAPTDPRLISLYKERQDLETQVEALKRLKPTLTQAMYDEELEKLLLDLADKAEAIRVLEGSIK